MQSLEGFDFFPLTYNADGTPEAAADLDRLAQRVDAASVTDLIIIAHGFRNDVDDATRVYTGFLKTFRPHITRPEFQPALGDRRVVVAGVYWPSKTYRETFDSAEDGSRDIARPAPLVRAKARLVDMKEHDAAPTGRPKIDRAIALLPALEGNLSAQDEFVALVLSLLDDTALDASEGVQQIKAQRGSDVLAKLDSSRGVFDSITGRINQFLNLTTWYLMKDRSGVVGARGVADAVRALKARRSSMKVHLVGHSLGGRLVAACANSLCTAPPMRVDSMTLLEGAFSHYGFSADNGHGAPGAFRAVVSSNIIKGPIVATFSAEDSVVGTAYALVSRLAGDSTREIGNASDPFGGIGRNGAQRTAEAVAGRLTAPGRPYAFKAGVIASLDGSGGFIKDHGDVMNAAVTYAFASAVAST